MIQNKVKEYREKSGISQTQLARRVEIASQNLSAIERGKLEAWPKVRKDLAKVLNVPESELFPSM
jgi:putative transcriptional regulator